MQFAKIDRKSAEYPDMLGQISGAPKQLFVDGTLPLGPCVAVVGSRTPTRYGEDVTYLLSYELARAGITVISGLAIGIDAIAHRAAIDAGGQTIAVLGCGLDVNNPAANKSLRDKIPRHGAVISEYEPGTPSLNFHFPQRNRIVAGLSQAVVVTEANASSGALITAKLALDNNRTVMAIPGNVTSLRSAGPNNLIRSGAIPVLSASDVLLELNIENADNPKTIKADSREEAAIMELLVSGVNTSEEMIERLEMSASLFAQIISLMEISGKVKQLGGGHWTLSR